MPSNNPRVNITLEANVVEMLSSLAQQEAKSVSILSRELIIEALERPEDQFLSAIAQRRDTKKAKRIDHNDAWN